MAHDGTISIQQQKLSGHLPTPISQVVMRELAICMSMLRSLLSMQKVSS
jgi:hypothetical protein